MFDIETSSTAINFGSDMVVCKESSCGLGGDSYYCSLWTPVGKVIDGEECGSVLRLNSGSDSFADILMLGVSQGRVVNPYR